MDKNNKQLKIGELPELNIVPIKKIIFHEDPDEERSSKLVENLRKENKLKNPPVVAKHDGNDKFILLDGANRLTALKKLDIPDALVQTIDLFDEDLLVLQWHHAIEHFTKGAFLDKISKIPALNVSKIGSQLVENGVDGELLCQIQFSDSSVYAVHAHENIFQRVQDLQSITEIYHSSKFMDRVSYTTLDHLKKNYPDFTAVVVFRAISKKDLVNVTNANKRIPSGITRIILPKRALRINVPLDILRFDVPVDQKNHWLQKRVNDQIRDKSIRFYHEPTFLFDE